MKTNVDEKCKVFQDFLKRFIKNFIHLFTLTIPSSHDGINQRFLMLANSGKTKRIKQSSQTNRKWSQKANPSFRHLQKTVISTARTTSLSAIRKFRFSPFRETIAEHDNRCFSSHFLHKLQSPLKEEIERWRE